MFAEAWLHFCDHEKEEGFYHYHQKSQSTPSPLHHVVNAPLCFGKNTGLPCQPLWPLPYPDGLGVSHQGPRPSGSCVGPLYRPSHRFLPASVWTGSLDCLSFTATGFLSAPRSSRLLSSYRQPGADRVKAVILENWVRRGEMCTMFVRERDSEFPVHIIALLRIPVLSQCRT